MDEQYLNVSDFATRSGLSSQRIYQLMKEGEIVSQEILEVVAIDVKYLDIVQKRNKTVGRPAK